ncbi:hypothetical protein CYY_004343 [Polysphondylium violaceum]|uniref:Alpha-2-macroglobulin domain-containing protein n=1 Tax=Polysphondylium violaceum TaxID=133409 RepID=A0A8J4V0E9_9MYCE|nr:hypothetical protein CYY_004343 [Polysphondylium violaceum]
MKFRHLSIVVVVVLLAAIVTANLDHGTDQVELNNHAAGSKYLQSVGPPPKPFKEILLPPKVPIASSGPVIVAQTPPSMGTKGPVTTQSTPTPTTTTSSSIQTIKVLSIIPQTGSSLDNNQPIIVTFDKAVIKLGEISHFFPFQLKCNTMEPIVGNYRWVTTFIARFDVQHTWPSDLNCTFTILSDPGLPLEKIPDPLQYNSPPPQFTISGVESPKTISFTNGSWSSDIPGIIDGSKIIKGVNEVPPDGIIRLNIGRVGKVDSDILNKNLVIYSVSEKKKIPFTIVDCPPQQNRPMIRPLRSFIPIRPSYQDTSFSFCITPTKPLLKDNLYSITVPKGVRLDSQSGPLSVDLEVQVVGLYSFIFPVEDYLLQPSARSFYLYLRHGVDKSIVSSKLFASAFSITPKVPNLKFEIQNPTTLFINGDFKPGNYSFSITGTDKIKDNWGLPLVSQKFVVVVQPSIALKIVSSNSMFEPSDKIDGFYTIYRDLGQYWGYNGSNPFVLKAYPVTEKNILEILETLTKNQVVIKEKPFASIVLKETDSTIRQKTFDIANIFKVSNCYLQVITRGDYDNTMNLVTKTTIDVTQLLVTQYIRTFWVTHLSNNSNVADAKISIYNTDSTYLSKTPIKLEGTSKTIGDGTSRIQNSQNTEGYVVVQKGSDFLIVPKLSSYVGQGNDIQGEIVTDRRLYNAGDNINIKAYFKGKSVASHKFTLTVYWNIQQRSITFTQKLVGVDYNFGTYSGTIKVPELTDFGSYSIQISTEGNDRGDSSTFYKEIYISDPRLPSAIISLTSNNTFIKNQDENTRATINLNLSSYLGSPLNNQSVQVEWKVNSNYFNTQTSTPTSGSDYFVTDDNGNALVSFYFPVKDDKFKVGDLISFSAKYLDQSNSLVESKSNPELYILDSEYNIQITGDIYNVAPGIPQFIFANVYHTPTSTLVNNVTVSVKLFNQISKKIASPLSSKFSQVEQESTLENVLSDILFINDDKSQVKLAAKKPAPTKEPSNSGECIFTTSKMTSQGPPCSYVLSKIGAIYTIHASAVAPNGDKISNSINVGEPSSTWDLNPYRMRSDLAIYTDKSEYQSNEKIVLSFFNPFKQSKVLFEFGCNSSSNHQQFEGLYGYHSYSFHIPKQCNSYCNFIVVLLGKGHGFTLPKELRTSLFYYDPNKASVQEGTVTKIIKNKPTMNLEFEFDKPTWTPNTKSSITLRIRDIETRQLVNSEVDVCIMVVDKRNLDLVPSPISNGDGLVQSTLYPFSRNSRTSLLKNYLAQIKQILKRLDIEKWYYFNWESSFFDYSDDQFDGVFATWITQTFSPYSMFERSALPIFAAAKGGANFDAMATTEASSGSSPSTHLRQNFKTTPLFVGSVIVTNGSITVPIQTPDDITTFRVVAYVYTKSSSLYSKETTIISKKDISVSAIVPRFVRTGDQFEAGVSIETFSSIHMDSKGLRVIAKLDNLCISLLDSLNLKPISLTGSLTKVFFNFTSNYQDRAIINFFLYKGSQLLDAVQTEFDVLPRQPPIYVGTSFAISEKEPFEQGIEIPNAEQGTGSMLLIAGAGHYPSVEEKCIKLLNLDIQRSLSSVEVLSQQVTYGALTSYGYNSSLILKSQQVLNQVIQGFSSYIEYPNSIKWYPSSQSSDFYPTLYAAVLKNLMSSCNIDGWSIIGDFSNTWNSFIDTKLNEMLANDIRSNNTINKELIGYASLGLGYWAPSNEDLVDKYSFNALTQNITDNCSLLCQTYFALASVMRGEVDPAFIYQVIQNIQSSIRVQGQTAYVSMDNSPHSSLQITTYASILFIMTSQTNPLLEKMINFIGSGGISHPIGLYYPVDPSSETLALSIIAMTFYDKSFTNNTPLSLNFTAFQDKESQTLINHFFSQTSFENIKEKFDFDSLYSPNGTIHFEAHGNGQISISLGLTYTPTDLPKSPVNNGFSVEKAIFIQGSVTGNNQSTDTNPNRFNVGDQVRVVISIYSPDDIGVVMVEDGASGSIEPLDNNIYSDSQPNSIPYSYTFNPFQYRETRKDKVIFQTTQLTAGTFEVEYNCIVTTKGSFIIPPTKVFAVNQPEVFGLSSAFNIIVN